jgi:hypothetical protein
MAGDATPQHTRNGSWSSPTGVIPSSSVSFPAGANSNSGATHEVVVKTLSTITSLPVPTVVRLQTARTASTLSSVSTVTTQSATTNAAAPAHSVSTAFAAMVNQILSPFAGNTPTAPPADSPAALVLLAAVRRELSGAATNLDQPSPTTVSPTLVLNGFNVVPSSTEHVTAFYGLFTMPPATLGVVQGEQEFDVFDPTTGETVGTFEALVSNTNSFFLGGGKFQELVVTNVVAGMEGTAAGDTPPVGSLIATNQFGPFGTVYTSMPSASGNVVSFKLATPFGDISIPLRYDAAVVLSSVSRPVQVTQDYYIAPVTSSTENVTAITGVPPYFAVAQGDQLFGVYQTGTDALIGTFYGKVTTTSDIGRNSSEAILVTEVVSGTVGTEPGDVPSVGTVYNVIYHDQLGIGSFYSAVPSPSGDVITFYLMTPFGDVPVHINYDAAAPPVIQSLSVPGGYSLVPTSTLQPTGINGLPPREVQIQGYQQFDVYDSAGSQIGSFDADVTTQWGFLGTYTEAVLVTNDTVGTPGTGPGDVPPVGSQFNFIYYPASGFGLYYSAIPSPSGDVLTFKIMTPFGDISIPAGYNAIKGLDDVSYFDPFLP